MEFETPRSLLRRLNLGREEALQRMLTCLILRGPYPKWNSRSSLSQEGRTFLDALSQLSFGTSLDEHAPVFVDELELAGRHQDERGGAPDWAVLLPDRLWIIELKTEAASHRREQIPLYFDLGHHHFPRMPVDITYLTPRGTATHESPEGPDRFAHLTWDDVRPLISAAWSNPRATGEAAVVAGVLRTIDELGMKPAEWRRGITGDVAEEVGAPVVAQPAAILPKPTTDDWGSVVASTADDHKQRAVDAVASSLDDLLELRLRIDEHCRTSPDPRVGHVRPWLWRTASGGTAMTEGGRTTGYEVRVSWYTTPAVENTSLSRGRGPLETRYLQVHPDASTGIDVCRWFEQHPNRWYTHAEIKAAVGCSDRIIREHLPAALNEPGIVRIEIDTSEQAWRYRYRPEADSGTPAGADRRTRRRAMTTTPSIGRPLCPSCFIPLNPSGECDLCGHRAGG